MFVLKFRNSFNGYLSTSEVKLELKKNLVEVSDIIKESVTEKIQIITCFRKTSLSMIFVNFRERNLLSLKINTCFRNSLCIEIICCEFGKMWNIDVETTQIFQKNQKFCFLIMFCCSSTPFFHIFR